MTKIVEMPLIEQDFSQKTERDLWLIIEVYGGEIFIINRQANKGNIDEEFANKQIPAYKTIQTKALEQITQRFGVVLYPKGFDGNVGNLPPLPEGKKYYWDWYKEWKLLILQEALESMICSACPFFGDVNELSRHIPCTILPSGMTLCNLHPAWRCGLVPSGAKNLEPGEMTIDQLHEKIKKKGGKIALEKFVKKEKDLQNAYFQK